MSLSVALDHMEILAARRENEWRAHEARSGG